MKFTKSLLETALGLRSNKIADHSPKGNYVVEAKKVPAGQKRPSWTGPEHASEIVADKHEFHKKAADLASKLHKKHPNLGIVHHLGGGAHHVISNATGEVFARWDYAKNHGEIDHHNAGDPIYPIKEEANSVKDGHSWQADEHLKAAAKHPKNSKKWHAAMAAHHESKAEHFHVAGVSALADKHSAKAEEHLGQMHEDLNESFDKLTLAQLKAKHATEHESGGGSDKSYKNMAKIESHVEKTFGKSALSGMLKATTDHALSAGPHRVHEETIVEAVTLVHKGDGGHHRVTVNDKGMVIAKFDDSSDPNKPSGRGSDQSLANYTSTRGNEGSAEAKKRLHGALTAAHATGDKKKVLAAMKSNGYGHHDWKLHEEVLDESLTESEKYTDEHGVTWDDEGNSNKGHTNWGKGPKWKPSNKMPKSKIFHHVEYKDRDHAKNEGMKWDNVAKKWYHNDFGKSATSKFKVIREEEELNELSKKTLGSYVLKAAQGYANASVAKEKHQTDADQLQRMTHNAPPELRKAATDAQNVAHKSSYAADNKRMKRGLGMHRALEKLTKEEVELDEADSRAAAQKGLMDNADRQHMKMGRQTDFYSTKNGDKISGTVHSVDDNGVTMHANKSHHAEHGKVHKFKFSSLQEDVGLDEEHGHRFHVVYSDPSAKTAKEREAKQEKHLIVTKAKTKFYASAIARAHFKNNGLTVHSINDAKLQEDAEIVEEHKTQAAAQIRLDAIEKKHPSAKHSVIQGRKSGLWHVVRHTSGGMNVVEGDESEADYQAYKKSLKDEKQKKADLVKSIVKPKKESNNG